MLKISIIFSLFLFAAGLSAQDNQFVFGDTTNITRRYTEPNYRISLDGSYIFKESEDLNSGSVGLLFLGKFSSWELEEQFSWKRFGTGVQFNYYFEDMLRFSLGMPLNYTLGNSFNAYVMPKMIFLEEEENNIKADFGFRFGLLYDVRFNNFVVAPFVAQEIQDYNVTWFFGINFGYLFHSGS